jgi:hypothetical protein
MVVCVIDMKIAGYEAVTRDWPGHDSDEEFGASVLGIEQKMLNCITGDYMGEPEARSVTNGASITRFDKPVCLDTVLKLKLN